MISVRTLLELALLSPLLGFITVMFTPRANEARIAMIASISSMANLLAVLGLGASFLMGSEPSIEIDSGVLARFGSYDLNVVWIIDRLSLVYASLAGFFASLVATYSRYYLHREPRYKSFFLIFHLYVIGLMFLSFGGNFSILFAGWEFISIASFILIAFYNERDQPVRAALFVLGIYRFCDLGLIFAIVLSHRAFLPDHSAQAMWVGFGLLLAACGKSAQFPFSGWLRKAMEGPTPSSAIFYGALSVHAGAFLLLRVAPTMEHLTEVRVAMSVIGALSAIIATGVGRTESNIKARIGWAAITQVGIIFLEIAAGLYTLALVHMAANAMLRCYQLLVSPSVVAALLREQSSLKAPRALDDFSVETLLPKKLRASLYAFAISQAYTDQIFDRFFFTPFRRLSRRLHLFSESLPSSAGIIFIVTLALPALVDLTGSHLPTAIGFFAISVLAFGMVSRGLGPSIALKTWLLIGTLQLSMGIALFLEHESLFLSIAQIGTALTCMVLGFTTSKAPRIRRNQVIFFCATLVMVGYPLGIPFVTEDILVHHFVADQVTAAFALGLCCTLAGWSAIRAFVSIFWESQRN